VTLGRLQRGERVLVHAAAGGVGLAAVQICQHLGAEVFATAGSEAKREHLRRLGVRHVMSSRTLEWAQQTRERTAGRGVDVVLNSLAGEAIQRGLEVLGPYGRFLELGAQDIFQNAQLGLLPFRNSLSFFAVMIGPGMPGFAQTWRALMAHFDRGELRPLPYVTFPAREAVAAFEYMAAAKHIGKVVVELGGRGLLDALGRR
jgi:NADPH:quinone reductase-like Zn-dependent oxidoreductase